MMSPEDFSQEFEILTGYAPFLWQKRLFNEWMADSKLISAVDIPTGLGKTNVMAIWLLARAAHAKLPRRLVYVVDRRAVVDQATKIAEGLRDKISETVATALGLESNPPNLPISTLRGGFAGDREWLNNPVSPAIIVGTIDMIGSRLLFEGYGVSRWMRPIHAGLLGIDSLVVLDESHLCPAFESLLLQISSEQPHSHGATPSVDVYNPPFQLMSLSATGRGPIDEESVFRLQASDCDDQVVKQRVTANKRLKIYELDDQKKQLEAMTSRAIELAKSEDDVRIVVFCNSRKDAVAIKKKIDLGIKKAHKEIERFEADSELLVGERRIWERAKLENWLIRRGYVDEGGERANGSSFLIATSAGEVGVDLDADHMVCDLVPYERMVQRLGRVNRRGNRAYSIVDVFAPKPFAKGGSKDAQSDFRAHENRLRPLKLLPIDADGRQDASPDALTALKADQLVAIEDATSPTPLYPPLNQPVLDAWAMTSLETHTGRPEVTPWLRGWDDDDVPHTEVVWRKYLPTLSREGRVDIDPKMVSEFFRAAPLELVERLEAETSHVSDWLKKRMSQINRHEDSEARPFEERDVVAIALNRRNEYQTHVTFQNLAEYSRPLKDMSTRIKRERDRFFNQLEGALLIIDSRLRGLCDGMLDESSNERVWTLDDRESSDGDASDTESRIESLAFRIERVPLHDEQSELVSTAPYTNWRLVQTFETSFNDENVATEGIAVYVKPGVSTNESSRSILSKPQSLKDHAHQTALKAKDLATQLKLPSEEIDAIEIAARWHDNGKAAHRWQTAMKAPSCGGPYAKTRGGGNVRLLDGYRHEFGSLIQAERAKLSIEIRDLVLHLIAAHHGRARPVISASGCDEGPPSVLNSSAGEAAIRFARLQKKYGHWGLAWREAILRIADQIASREWEERTNTERSSIHG